ncbi:hypothetical protein [Salininema proteolyticum]|uniref:Uncharacterized protein n=1 Tax=Salininema proteolyticum TaxID=1607685 RepID=A0ABV8TV14_9ACTN
MGWFDGWKEAMVDGYFDQQEWLRNDGKSAPVKEIDSEGGLDSVPTRHEVLDLVETFTPIFEEGYRRQIAHDRFGDQTDIFFKTDDRARSKLKLKEDGYWIEQADDERQREYPSQNFVLGVYRYSDELGFFMPSEIPESMEIGNLEELKSSWRPSSSSDVHDIWRQAHHEASKTTSEIKDAFDEAMLQCDIDGIKELIDHVNGIGKSMNDIYDQHRDSSVKEVLDVWDSWEGDDADAAYETFGNNLPGAMAMQREGSFRIAEAVSAEGSAQASAMIACYNSMAVIWERLLEELNPTTPLDKSVNKVTGSLSVNRIPWAGDIIATTDFVVEVATDGKLEGLFASIVSKAISVVFPDHENVPDGAICGKIREWLCEAAVEILDELYNSRSEYQKSLDTHELSWQEKWSTDTIYQVIPGYQG